MPTWKLTLEYEGSRYRGWQMQKNADRTVQAVLAHAGGRVIGLDAVPEEIETYRGAGFAAAHTLVGYHGVIPGIHGQEFLFPPKQESDPTHIRLAGQKGKSES